MACAASDLESQAWAPVQAGICSVWENRPKFGSGFRPTPHRASTLQLASCSGPVYCFSWAPPQPL